LRAGGAGGGLLAVHDTTAAAVTATISLLNIKRVSGC
jgi:hypothetical protein